MRTLDLSDWEEARSALGGSVPVALTRGLGVHGDHEPWIAVTESDLCGLNVDAFEKKSGGGCTAKIVEPDTWYSGRICRGQRDRTSRQFSDQEN